MSIKLFIRPIINLIILLPMLALPVEAKHAAKKHAPVHKAVHHKPAAKPSAATADEDSSETSASDWPQPQPLTHDDAGIHAFIAKVRERALKIKIDGKANDWKGIPVFYQKVTQIDDPSRTITRAAIAPLDDALLVMIGTYGKPSHDNGAFAIEVDYTGHVKYDITINLRPYILCNLWIRDENQPDVSHTIDGIECAIDDVVEVRIPYSALSETLPPHMSPYASNPNNHPWIRVATSSWGTSVTDAVDWGPAVCSYPLLARSYPLDAPLHPHDLPFAIDMPIHGKWWIAQGAFGLATHKNIWAYDFSINDAKMHWAPVPDPHFADLSYSWRQPIYAPTGARTIDFRSDVPDNLTIIPSLSYYDSNPPSNSLYLDIGQRTALFFNHLSQNSVSVKPGAAVHDGEVVGLVGSSGAMAPHLHMGYYSLSEPNKTLPLAFKNVTVSLNAAPDDPWARNLAYWEPREGLFVEPWNGTVSGSENTNKNAEPQK